MSSIPEPVFVFVYGSLMFAPELPESLLGSERAWLAGQRRDLNKRSRPRGCSAEEAAWPDLEVPPAFEEGGFLFSLALGTVGAEGERLEGRLLRYPAAVREELLTVMDAREGVFHRSLDQDSYVRTVRTVETGSGRAQEAIVYLVNPHGRFYAPDLTPDEQARVLLRATPKHDRGRALGVHYLLESRRVLRAGGISCPDLDRVAEAVRQLPGPWQQALRAEL